MFQTIAAWIGQYISYFPLVIFISLFLGGFNLPISEDIIVITAALLCRQEKASIPSFYAALYFGAVISDYLVYFWGWLLGHGRISGKFFSKLLFFSKVLFLLIFSTFTFNSNGICSGFVIKESESFNSVSFG